MISKPPQLTVTATLTGVVFCSALLVLTGHSAFTQEATTGISNIMGSAALLSGLVAALMYPKLAVKARRASFAEKALNSTDVGYWILTAEGAFIEVNDAYCNMVGWSREEILSMSIAHFERTATQAQISEKVQRIHRRGIEQFETQHRKSNHEWIDLEVTVTRADKHHVVVLLRDISDRKLAAKQINHLAYYDPLTTLPNRRLLHDKIEQAQRNSHRTQHHSAIILLNLDNFRMLNDALGFDKGDQILTQVAHRIQAQVRPSDTVARMAGNEFAVVLENLTTEATQAAVEAEEIASNILVSVAKPYRLGLTDHHVSSSVGITVFHDHRHSVDDLLRQVDLASMKSHDKGRDCLNFYDSAMQEAVESHAGMVADMRLGLASSHQFELYYQAQVDQENRVIGAEALLRWHHPTRGMVSPCDFIPVAEESGLMVPLGTWALNAACRQLACWSHQPNMSDLSVAVNISACQIQQDDFVASVKAVIDKHQVNPRRLKLELTESMMVSDIKGIIAKMRALKALGLELALDDFGTGYSSLAYLTQLPLDQLKIDRSFVKDIETSDNACVVSSMLISMAHHLNLKVVAEGVETPAQLYFLRTVHGCDFIQGYRVSKPLSVAAFETFVDEHQCKRIDVPRQQRPAFKSAFHSALH